jgi:hypothetical protein
MYMNHSSAPFVQGLDSFMINVVIAYMTHNVAPLGYIKCPCEDCKNLEQWDSIKLIYCHLLHRGFMANYMVDKTWGRR